jgi:hypothetical protein
MILLQWLLAYKLLAQRYSSFVKQKSSLEVVYRLNEWSLRKRKKSHRPTSLTSDVNHPLARYHIFQLSDEQYARLAAYAALQKQTPETLFQAWVNEVTHSVEAFTSSSRKEQVGQEGQAGSEEAPQNHPLLQVAGMFAIGEPG